MKRFIGLVAVVAAAAFVAVPASMATPNPNNKGHGPVCITDFTKLDGGAFSGKHAITSNGTVDLSTGLAKQAVADGAAFLGSCGGGGEDLVAVCVTSGEYDFIDGKTLPADFQLNSEDAATVIANEDGFLGSCAGDSGAGPNAPAGVFLCYSTDQTTPGVWPADQVADLLKAGYWQAYAVKGNVAGGTNVGAFHLVCNVAAGQALGLQFADEGGWSTNANDHSAVAGAIGWYSVISG